MALDMFLYFDGSSKIEGETKDKAFSSKKAIDILGISERALRYKLKDYKEKGFYSD